MRIQPFRGACVASLILLLGAFVSCDRRPERDAAESTIRIGFLPTSKERFADIGRSISDAAELAVRQVNQNGGLEVGDRKYPISLLVEDAPNNPEAALRYAHKLINQERVVVLVGPYLSTIALPVAVVAEQSHVPMISPSATNPEVTAGKQYVFRTSFVDAFQGRVMARFAREELAARTAAVLYDIASPYNRGIAEVFKKAFKKMGGRIVAYTSYTTGEQDFHAQLTLIRRHTPEVLYLPDDNNDLHFKVEQARSLGIHAVFLGSDGWDELRLDTMPLEGAFYTTQWHPEIANAQAQAFIEAYRMATGSIPTARAVLTYDAFGLIFQAIKQQGKADPESIRRGLAGMGRYVGAGGAMTFRGTGDPEKSAVIVQIRDGRARFYRIVDPSSSAIP